MAPVNPASRWMKPQRPRRPLSGYNTFMKNFMSNKRLASSEDARNAIKGGARLWSEMSSSGKDKYRAQYEKEMLTYRQVLESQKSPPRPFAAFLKDYYQSGQFEMPEAVDNRTVISSLGKSASSAWHNLPSSQRQDYTRQFQDEYQEYKNRQTQQSETQDLEANQNDTPTEMIPVKQTISKTECIEAQGRKHGEKILAEGTICTLCNQQIPLTV